MPAPAIATIVLAVVVVLVLAGFLLAIARVLLDVHRKLGPVIEAVGMIASQAKPVDPVVRSITSNLATAQGGLSSLLESKVGVDGAAQLVASVDPLAKESPSPRSFARADEFDDEPSPHEPSPHSFARADQDELGADSNLADDSDLGDDSDPKKRAHRPFPGGGGGGIHFGSRD